MSLMLTEMGGVETWNTETGSVDEMTAPPQGIDRIPSDIGKKVGTAPRLRAEPRKA